MNSWPQLYLHRYCREISDKETGFHSPQTGSLLLVPSAGSSRCPPPPPPNMGQEKHCGLNDCRQPGDQGNHLHKLKPEMLISAIKLM